MTTRKTMDNQLVTLGLIFIILGLSISVLGLPEATRKQCVFTAQLLGISVFDLAIIDPNCNPMAMIIGFFAPITPLMWIGGLVMVILGAKEGNSRKEKPQKNRTKTTIRGRTAKGKKEVPRRGRR